MLTLRDALQMQCFAGVRVVAGHAGLDREIRRIHIVDMPDSQYKWARGGELLLTTGLGLKAAPERQTTLIPELAGKGIVGLVLSCGYYLDRAPDAMREAADRLGFPLIEAPPELMFIDVTEAVFTRIVNEQYEIQQRAFAIHRRLTQIVLEGGDVQQVVEALAAALERSVAIEDAAFHALASAQHGPTDDMWAQATPGRTPPELVQRFLDQGIYERLSAERRPLRIPPIPELGMTMERIATPIVVGRQTYGYVWIIAGGRPLADLDTLAIDHAATVAALIILRDKAVRQAEHKVRGDLFEQLLSGVNPEGAAHQLGLRSERNHAVLVLAGRDMGPEAASEVEQALKAGGWNALVVPRDERVIAVVECKSDSHARSIADSLSQTLSHSPSLAARRRERREKSTAASVLIGLGQTYAGQAGIQRSYAQAMETTRLAEMLGDVQGVVEFARLGILHWLYHLPAERQRENRFVEIIAGLHDYDLEHKADLLDTLETYLDSGNALAEASAALNVHRNTLLYRLRRIEELTGLDLRNPAERLNLHVAIKGYRLWRGQQSPLANPSAID